MSHELQQFASVGILLIMAVAFSAANILLPSLLGKRRTPGAVKDSPYECGLPPAGNVRARFSVKFYLVALLFILFDLEVVFVVSWATVYRDLVRPVAAGGIGPVIFYAMLVFMVILEIGHFYVWKQGALNWAPQRRIAPPTPSEPAS